MRGKQLQSWKMSFREKVRKPKNIRKRIVIFCLASERKRQEKNLEKQLNENCLSESGLIIIVDLGITCGAL